MADEIRQQLTFDASTAIAELSKLTQSLDTSRTALNNFGTSVSNFNRQASGAVATMQGLATSAGNLQASLRGGLIPPQTTANLQQSSGLVDQFGNSLSKQAGTAKVAATANTAAARSAIGVGSASSKAMTGVNQLNISFTTLARVIQTQLIVRAFSAFTRGLGTATREAAEFQKTISEIQSITDNAFGSFDAAASAVRGLSDAFNLSLGDVGEGLYQVISNQIQGAATQVDVLTAALKLGKVGSTDAESSINLLTGTINAFELNANDANRVAGIFFETVRLGRTRISELAQSFGAVAPIFAEAGGEVEELAGAFAAVTINGVNTAKAATQLRGIINAFLKPTTEMTKVLNEAGFSSGELAIQTLGLGGALALIQDSTGGSATELAKLIPRVRGLSGAMILARNNGETLDKTVQALRATTSELLEEKLELRLETNAEQVERELNQVKNALTVDLGQALLATAKNFLDAVGGADTLVAVIKVMTPLLIGVGTSAIIAAVSLGAYALAAKTASGANILLGTTSKFARRGLLSLGISRQLTRSLLGFARSATPIGIGFAIGSAIGFGLNDALVSNANKAAKESADALGRALIAGELGQDLERVREEARVRIKAIKDVTKEQVLALNEIKKLETARTKTFLDSNAEIFADTQKLFSALTSANNKLIQDLTRERDTADKAQSSSLSRQANLRSTIEDRAFKQSIGFLSDRRKLFALESQGAALAADANSKLASARTEADAKTALDQLKRAEGFIQEAAAIASSSGSLSDQNRLFRQRQAISSATLRSEQQFAATQAQIKRDAEAALVVEQKRVAELNREVKEAQAAISAFKNAATQEERLTAARKARAEIADITPELALGVGEVDFSQLVSLETFKDNLSREIRNADLAFAPDQLIGATELNNLTNAFAQATTEATLTGIGQAVTELSAAGIDLEIDIDFSQSSVAALQSALDQIQKGSKTQQDEITEATNRTGDAVTRNIAGQKALDEAQKRSENSAAAFISTLANAATLDTEGFLKFENVLNIIRDRLRETGNNLENLTPESAEVELNKLAVAFQKVDDAADFVSRAQLAPLRDEIIQLLELLNIANNPAGGGNKSAEVAADISTLPESGAGLNAQLRQGVNLSARIANNINSISQIQPSVPAATAATGKFFPKFLAGGGLSSRGTDTVPAMLSPGEFVVNARSSRRFFSQLQAINAGVKPIFRQEGGPVTSVGDINVTVNGGKDADATGRTVARSIRRELRRGTSSLK